MQRDFVLPSSVCCVAGAQATVPAISRMLEYARASGWAVIHIVRRHRPGGVDAEHFRRHLFAGGGQFCVEGSEGARIVSGLEPRPGDYVVAKTRFDAFFRTDLEVLLRGLGTEEVYICGTQYPNCVRSTAVGAIERDYAVTVVTDCSDIAYAIVQPAARRHPRHSRGQHCRHARHGHTVPAFGRYNVTYLRRLCQKLINLPSY